MKMLLFFLFCAVALIFNVEGDPKLKQSENITVNISQGTLQGERVVSNLTGGQYYSFRGIPYARPPVGSLRFQAPLEAPSWTGVRNATFHRSICLQPQPTNGGVVGSEDCLYLNVYTPQLPSGSGRNLLPVMVWIHGGGFLVGSGNADNLHPDYLIEKGVVLVTINYRLGVIGFLGLNNSHISINNGLKDQMAALKWVQSNIEQFGGDKNQVTIFGESAGSGSVAFQMVSPATKGLFHRAISQSGNAIYEGFYYGPSEAREMALHFGRKLGIATGNEDALVNYLMNVTGERLIATLDMLEPLYRFKYLEFRATLESGADAFLPDSPLNIMKAGSYQQVPYITGFNSAETKYFLQDYLHNATLWTELSMEQFVPDALNLPVGSQESLRLASEIKQVYFGNVTPTVSNIEELVNVFSDANFIYTALRSANFHVRTSSAPVYVYQFSYVGSLSTSQYLHFGYPFKGLPPPLMPLYEVMMMPTNHGPPRMLYLPAPELSRALRHRTQQEQHAESNPSEGQFFQWQSVTSSRHTYLDIGDDITSKNLDELHPHRFALWHGIYESIDN